MDETTLRGLAQARVDRLLSDRSAGAAYRFIVETMGTTGLMDDWTGSEIALDLVWAKMTPEEKRAQPKVLDHHSRELKG